jgi:cytochrome c
MTMKLKFALIKLSAAAAVAAASFSAPAFAMSDAAVEPYLKKQGCMKCHAIDKDKKGPAYKKIAAKYKGKPDGEAKVIKAMTEGLKVKLDDGTEDDHKVIDTKDPAELKAISAWILAK